MSFLRSIFGKSNKDKVDESQKSQETIAACPYCGTELEKKPTRKKKCPHCGNFIYVRKGQLFTEDGVKINDWLIRLEEFGVTQSDYDLAHKALSKQFGQDASVEDTLWKILNSLVGKRNVDVSQVYRYMASIVRSEGKDPRPYIAESIKARLLQEKSQGVKRVEIRTCNDDHVCPECKALAGKVFSIEDAIADMPIPSHCTSPTGCRCGWSPVIDSYD